MTKEEIIVDKIDQLCNQTILFLEGERKLSPAGKFQACLLTSASVFMLIEENFKNYDLYGQNIERILLLLKEKFNKRFKRYAEEYRNSNFKTEDLHNKTLNNLLKDSNDALLDNNEQFITDAIFIGISHLWKESKEYQLGFENFNSGKGKVVFPELTFISLYIQPFFIILVEDAYSPRMYALIDNEVKFSDLEDFDFMLLPAKLGDYLALCLNKDENFRFIMSSDSRVNYQKNNSKNQGCMLLFSIIILMVGFTLLF